MEAPGAAEFLPLTETVWEILLALSEEERHGYGILIEIEERTGGRLRLLPGTLYRALHRLREQGVVELAESSREAGEDPRRRVFRLTGLGRRVAAAEARRLAAGVRVARARGLLQPEETR